MCTLLQDINLGSSPSCILPSTLLFLSRIQHQLFAYRRCIENNPRQVQQIQREKPPISRIAKGGEGAVHQLWRTAEESTRARTTFRVKSKSLVYTSPPSIPCEKRKKKKKVNLGREGGPAALERVKYPKHRMETPFIKSKCLDFLNGRGIQSLGVARHNSVVCLSWNAGQQRQGFFQYPSNGPRQLARANLYGKNTLNLPLVFLICG